MSRAWGVEPRAEPDKDDRRQEKKPVHLVLHRNLPCAPDKLLPAITLRSGIRRARPKLYTGDRPMILPVHTFTVRSKV